MVFLFSLHVFYVFLAAYQNNFLFLPVQKIKIMALTLYNIKRWYLMLTGQSVLHVHQDLGKCFAAGEVRGYYNNLTEKVTMEPALLESDDLPLLDIGHGEKVHFPVAIFQYGLGAYDLYLLTGEEVYRRKFEQCLRWTVEHQEDSGAWSNFFYIYPDHPYGAMAQGEGASLLIRGHVLTGKADYLQRAQRAIDFMLKPVEEGGTAVYDDHRLTLLEYTHMPAVMNGWVFALFGLYDYVTATGDKEHYAQLLDRTTASLEQTLPQFDRGYWSMYDLDGRIASPFYHRLHIAQMQALHRLTGHPVFDRYAARWQDDTTHVVRRTRAFLLKAWQKIKE